MVDEERPVLDRSVGNEAVSGNLVGRHAEAFQSIDSHGNKRE